MIPEERERLRREAGAAKMRAMRLLSLGDPEDRWQAFLLLRRAARLGLEAMEGEERPSEAAQVGVWIEACGLLLEARDPVRAAELWARLPRWVFFTAPGAALLERLKGPYQAAADDFAAVWRRLSGGAAQPDPSAVPPGELRAALEPYPGVPELWWALSARTPDPEEARRARDRAALLEPELADEAAARAAWDRLGLAFTSTLTLAMHAEPPGGALSLDAVSLIAATFGSLLHDFIERSFGGRLELSPGGATAGSFLLDVEARGLPPHALEELDDLVAGAPERVGARRLLDLLTLLQRSKVRLAVESAGAPRLIIDAARRRRLIRAARSAALRTLDSRDIPQADDIERVFNLVELAASHGTQGTHGHAVAAALAVVPRQVAYYRRAAGILGLVSPSGEVTPAGRLIARLGPEERLRATVVHFESSPCGDAWIRWSSGRTLLDVDPRVAADFLLASVPGLSASTAARRARTLQAWHRALAGHHYAAPPSAPPPRSHARRRR